MARNDRRVSRNPAIAARISIVCISLYKLASDSLNRAFRTSWFISVVIVDSTKSAQTGSEIMAACRKKIAQEMYEGSIH